MNGYAGRIERPEKHLSKHQEGGGCEEVKTQRAEDIGQLLLELEADRQVGTCEGLTSVVKGVMVQAPEGDVRREIPGGE